MARLQLPPDARPQREVFVPTSPRAHRDVILQPTRRHAAKTIWSLDGFASRWPAAALSVVDLSDSCARRHLR